EDESARIKCRKAWEEWWKTYDGPGVLKYLREQTPNGDERAKIQERIKQLKDDRFEVRVTATEELAKSGPAALPFLRRATFSSDAEVAARAKKALAAVEKANPHAPSAVAA